MTTNKRRVTIYLDHGSELEVLFDLVRGLLPLEARGRCTRSTITEAALAVALRDVQDHGRQSAVFQALVTTGNVTNPSEAQL